MRAYIESATDAVQVSRMLRPCELATLVRCLSAQAELAHAAGKRDTASRLTARVVELREGR